MARVHHARPQPQQGVSRAIALDKTRAAVKKKKPYKIVLEAVTQEKKKLHSILTYASNAPQGFGFVPAGHPEITEWCKEQCRQRNLDVHVVSAKPKNKTHADPEKLSHHVHRIGHHFPIEIIKLACSKFGYEYDEESGLRKLRVRDRENWIEQQVESYSTRQALHGCPATKEGSKDHISGAVREMFPKIPEADLSSIVNHAFEEGTNRVGNAKELPLARRVQLAVVAHIRHTYTDYDKMLKTGSWTEARQKVEHVSLAKLKEWRDETGEQSNEIEDTFREVIVLDDEDDDTSDGGGTPDEREQSMEIVSNRVTARDIQPERYPQYPYANDHERRRGHGRTIFVHPYPPSSATHGPPAARTARAHGESARPEPPYLKTSQPPTGSQTRPASDSRRAPNYMRDSDGRLYELLPIDDTPRLKYDSLHRPTAPSHVQERFPQPLPRVDAQPSRAPPPPPRRTSDQEVVLPSVERETIDLVSPPRNSNSQRALHERSFRTTEHSDSQSSKRKTHHTEPRLGDGYYNQYSKRSRPFLHEQELYAGTDLRQAASHPHTRGYEPTQMRPQQQAYPSQDVIDLTSSSRQPVSGKAGDMFPSVRGYPPSAPSKYGYMSEAQRHSAVRNDFHDHTIGTRPHAYNPEHDRMYQRRPPPAHEYVPLRR